MELETQCPQCSNNVFKETPDLNVDSEVTCAICSHSAKLGDFLTPDARNRINQAAKDALVKALSGIPGFKPR